MIPAAIDVRCPTCEALPGQFCRGWELSDGSSFSRTHEERRRLAKTAHHEQAQTISNTFLNQLDARERERTSGPIPRIAAALERIAGELEAQAADNKIAEITSPHAVAKSLCGSLTMLAAKWAEEYGQLGPAAKCQQDLLAWIERIEHDAGGWV
jgi:hypothetical protein